ncbi:hypothetical protein FOS05_23005 [Bacillus mycoides]|nr:hypothetical protein [Bacillus mycoides]QWI21814.1 hypothetical protein EXW34_10795 [Bacillus mycoides]TKI26369.1 hypothetical protein FC700_30800 [Bacillus mycoides]
MTKISNNKFTVQMHPSIILLLDAFELYKMRFLLSSFSLPHNIFNSAYTIAVTKSYISFTCRA